jgi:hypothetical protein
VDNIRRQAGYTGGTAADVLALIKAGQENTRLTSAQRSRKKHKRGGTRRAQNSRIGGLRAGQGLFIQDEVFPPPQVVEVFGQRWEIP